MQSSQLGISRPIGLCLALIAGMMLGAIALNSMGGSVAAQGPAPLAPQVALGTGFTYQGQLKRGTAPVNDNNCSVTFSLWDSQSNGTGQVGGSQLINPVAVADGLFTVYVNGGGQFGLNAFDGSDRWLQAAVQCAGDGVPVTLSRQRLSAAPYAFALPGLWIQRNAISPNIIGGHISNTISASAGSVIGGGGDASNPNTIDGSDSVIAGGSRNSINSNDSFIGGGFSNTVTAAAHEGTIGGGGNNSVRGDHAAIFAGINNATFGDESFVGGGSNNVAAAANSTVGGGSLNLANGAAAFIGGGSNNLITGTSSAAGATIAGGSQNVISATTFGDFSTIAGGGANTIRGGDVRYNTIGGGSDNSMAGSFAYATIGGGNANIVTGQGGTIPGGIGNQAGALSFAAGVLAKAKHDQSFVWNDDSLTEFDSTASHQFLIHATGGVGLGTNAPATQLHVVKSANGTATDPTQNVAVIENTNTGNSADVLALKIGGTASPATSNNFITFLLGNNTSAGSLEGNGSGGIELGGVGADYAEWLPRMNAGEPIAPGEIVGVFDGRISKQTRGAPLAMVVSTGPIVAGNDPGESARDGYAPVAFIGQAMARVRGAVRAGDFIVPSGLGDGAGVAVAPELISVEQFAQVVGEAWESTADESGPRPVRIVVGLIRNDPAVQRLAAQARTQTSQIEQLQQQNAALDARLSALEQNAQHSPATLGGVGAFAPEWLLAAGLTCAGMILARRLGIRI